MQQKWLLPTVFLLAATAGFAWTPEEQLKMKGVGDVHLIMFSIHESTIFLKPD